VRLRPMPCRRGIENARARLDRRASSDWFCSKLVGERFCFAAHRENLETAGEDWHKVCTNRAIARICPRCPLQGVASFQCQPNR
jgi:hypothetical protein